MTKPEKTETAKSQATNPATTPTRRDFLGDGLTVGALLAASFASGAQAKPSKSANEKLNIAYVGTQNRAWASIAGTMNENQVALCDVDKRNLDRAASQLTGRYKKPAPTLYRDYREMIEKEEKNIDAVVVGAADHAHAPPTAMALRRGKHVYCEKPLTHTVEEARIVAELAKKNKLATQMGTQIHAGDNYRRVAEVIASGAIGQVSEVYTWVGKSWSNGRFGKPQPAPAHLDWDLWLGPASERAYSAGIHPAHWRKFWEYGAGTMGDMAPHIIDIVFWALNLKHPDKVWSEGPAPHPDGTPRGLRCHWHYPAGKIGDKPRRDVTLHWSDSGNNPAILNQTKVNGKPLSRWGIGALFIGDKGKLATGYGSYALLPADDFKDFKAPPKSIPKSIGHHNEWVHACKTGAPTTCNFEYSGALTETILLGNVAFRAQEKLEWDGTKLEATNTKAAAQYVAKEYRKGWDLVRAENRLG